MAEYKQQSIITFIRQPKGTSKTKPSAAAGGPSVNNLGAPTQAAAAPKPRLQLRPIVVQQHAAARHSTEPGPDADAPHVSAKVSTAIAPQQHQPAQHVHAPLVQAGDGATEACDAPARSTARQRNQQAAACHHKPHPSTHKPCSGDHKAATVAGAAVTGLTPLQQQQQLQHSRAARSAYDFTMLNSSSPEDAGMEYRHRMKLKLHRRPAKAPADDARGATQKQMADGRRDSGLCPVDTTAARNVGSFPGAAAGDTHHAAEQDVSGGVGGGTSAEEDGGSQNNGSRGFSSDSGSSSSTGSGGSSSSSSGGSSGGSSWHASLEGGSGRHGGSNDVSSTEKRVASEFDSDNDHAEHAACQKKLKSRAASGRAAQKQEQRMPAKAQRSQRSASWAPKASKEPVMAAAKPAADAAPAAMHGAVWRGTHAALGKRASLFGVLPLQQVKAPADLLMQDDAGDEDARGADVAAADDDAAEATGGMAHVDEAGKGLAERKHQVRRHASSRASGEVHLLLPRLGLLTKPDTVLLEMPRRFDVDGDAGAIGRVVGGGDSTAQPSLDLKGMLYCLESKTLPGTAMLVKMTAGTGNKDPTAHVQHVFGTMLRATVAENDSDADMAGWDDGAASMSEDEGGAPGNSTAAPADHKATTHSSKKPAARKAPAGRGCKPKAAKRKAHAAGKRGIKRAGGVVKRGGGGGLGTAGARGGSSGSRGSGGGRGGRGGSGGRGKCAQSDDSEDMSY